MPISPRKTWNRFLGSLPKTFYADPEDARKALSLGRPFNVIYMPMAFKFDFFLAGAFRLGMENWIELSFCLTAASPRALRLS